LRDAISGAGSLAQELMTDPLIPGTPAITAHQLPKPTLGQNHPLSCRLFQQMAGNVLDAGLGAQSRVIQ
jgi:hypothetical protein